MTEMERRQARAIALELIRSEGVEPEFLSIAEGVGEWLYTHEIFDGEDEMVDEVNRLIKAATVTITFPDEGEL